MKVLFFVGIGGFFGAISRFLLNNWVHSTGLSSYPYGTFFVNIIGSFLIGVLFALSEKGVLSSEVRVILVSGLIGGFTTFSTFSLEAFALIRESQFLAAGLYLFGSISVGMIAVFLGGFLIKLL